MKEKSVEQFKREIRRLKSEIRQKDIIINQLKRIKKLKNIKT
jgi:hypothetical protein